MVSGWCLESIISATSSWPISYWTDSKSVGQAELLLYPQYVMILETLTLTYLVLIRNLEKVTLSRMSSRYIATVSCATCCSHTSLQRGYKELQSHATAFTQVSILLLLCSSNKKTCLVYSNFFFTFPWFKYDPPYDLQVLSTLSWLAMFNQGSRSCWNS